MRRASPSPGTPFSVLTGPTSGSLRWPALHFFHTLTAAICGSCEYWCDLLGRDSCAPDLIKHGHAAEVVAGGFFCGPLISPDFPVGKLKGSSRATAGGLVCTTSYRLQIEG